jgi:hypothetical protein
MTAAAVASAIAIVVTVARVADAEGALDVPIAAGAAGETAGPGAICRPRNMLHRRIRGRTNPGRTNLPARILSR